MLAYDKAPETPKREMARMPKVADTDSKTRHNTSMKSVAADNAPCNTSVMSVMKCAQCKDYAYYSAIPA